MEKKGWATGQCQGKFPRRDSDAIATWSLSTGCELSSQQSERKGCYSSLPPNVSWPQSAIFALRVTQQNEITSLLWPQAKDDRATENILKIIKNKRPRSYNWLSWNCMSGITIFLRYVSIFPLIEPLISTYSCNTGKMNEIWFLWSRIATCFSVNIGYSELGSIASQPSTLLCLVCLSLHHWAIHPRDQPWCFQTM